ncbi:MAG: hypothetical protein JW749_09170 [Sedimentisphaerales bacterium]|nr:hypothetical protein [Sedimentisphaerales bacterium]
MGPEENSKLKVCLAASAGGHSTQLLRLAKSWQGHDTFCVTTTEVVLDKLKEHGRTYVVGECNRKHPLLILKVLMRCCGIIFRERPDIVISTGAAAGCLVCLLGKMSGAKVIWIDSITNVERMSLSGRIVRPVADLMLVQWSHLLQQYKGIEYVGAVI